MAEVQAFETDFWKDANLRKVWDEIVPGAPRRTIPYTLTLEAIQKYCRAVGDLHPLYFDEAYAKTTPDRSDVVVCVVNLDPHHVQSGWLQLDPGALGLEPQQTYQMHDLLSGSHFLWHGPRNYVSLDPQRCPAHVMALRARLRREHDFDYFY